jgi:hypothetical protein
MISPEHTKKIVYLLGSGVSIRAGMLSTENITDKVMSEEDMFRSTDFYYHFGKKPTIIELQDLPDEYVRRIRTFLKRLKVEIELYYQYRLPRPTNYEDLFYVVNQIHDSESGDHDNPVIGAFIDKIFPDIKELFITRENEHNEWNLKSLTTETKNYIRYIAWSVLSKSPSCLDYFGFIKHACFDEYLSNRDIFTLNHDTNIEQYLLKNHIQFVDGFGEPEYEVRYWNPDLFESESNMVRLFKLHGSIDWFEFSKANGDRRIGIPLNNDIEHTKDSEGNFHHLVNQGYPLILLGTFNKMMEYISGIYSTLHYQFIKSLNNSQRLFISGYGFRDKGINIRIIEWIISSKNNKILIVHPKPESLKNESRGAIANKWDDWKEQGKLIIVPKRIEDVTKEDVSRIYDKS